jgi:hypothetical protein
MDKLGGVLFLDEIKMKDTNVKLVGIVILLVIAFLLISCSDEVEQVQPVIPTAFTLQPTDTPVPIWDKT